MKMKIFPKTKRAWIRFAILIALVLFFFRFDRVALFYLSDKQEGDILFQSLPSMDLVNAIEGITRSEHSHCGILLKKDGKWVVAEAIGMVRYTPLHLWILRGRGKRIHSYRVADLPPHAINVIKDEINRLYGLPYDFNYAPDDSAIYCSELVYKAYDRGLNLKIGEWEKLGDLDWEPFEDFIRKMEDGHLPLDRPMITPVGLTRSPLVSRIH